MKNRWAHDDDKQNAQMMWRMMVNRGRIIFIALLSLSLLCTTGAAQIASGGQYVLDKATIANGGGNSNGGVYNLVGTTGNPNASQKMSGGIYTQHGGFNSTPPLFPTGAVASISGRAVSSNNIGLKNAILFLRGGLMTAPRIARTNNSGYFSYSGVEVGYFYSIQIKYRNADFEEDTISFMLQGNLGDVTFRTTQ